MDGGIEQLDSILNGDKSPDLGSGGGYRVPASALLGDELALREGDSVLALRAPDGQGLTLTNVIISSFRRENAFLTANSWGFAPAPGANRIP